MPNIILSPKYTSVSGGKGIDIEKTGFISQNEVVLREKEACIMTIA